MRDPFQTAAMTFAAGVSLVGGQASAQALAAPSAAVDNFSRTRNVSVAERPRPDFEAVGIRSGSFFLYPRLEVSTDYQSNIYASSTGETDDFVGHLRPEVTLESNWSRHFLTAYARGALNRFVDSDSENSDEFGIGAAGRMDVLRYTNVGLGASYQNSFEPRSSPTAPTTAAEPVQLDMVNAFVSGARSSGRVRISARGDWRSYDYQDGRNGAGGVIDQDYRDRNVASGTARIDVAISPDTAFYVQATANGRQYDVASTTVLPNRDSTGQEYLVGVNFEAGATARGEIAVGYLKQDFDAALYEDESGFGARAALEWFATSLTTVTLSGARTVEDAANGGVGGYASTNAALRIDHELLRNVILNGALTLGQDDYSGIDREDQRLGVSAGATYLVNRHVGVSVAASSSQTESSGAARDRDFNQQTLSISLVTQF